MFSADIGILVLRVIVGLIFAGHGAQKLFGWFGGGGMAGTTKMMEQLNLRPPRFWAFVNAIAEFLGGLGLALGLLTPLAAAALVGSMLVAILRVHAKNGFWNSKRGIEFPLTLGTVAFVIGGMGAGQYALDALLRLTLPEPITYLVALLVMLLGTALALTTPRILRPHESAT
jgi:putative oxidoreductase